MDFSDQEVAVLRITLKQVSFFELLTMDELDLLMHALERQPFRKGDTIIREGQKGDRCYFVVSGAVGIYKGGMFSRKRIETKAPVRFFGEMALLFHALRNATVMGEQDGMLFSLSREAFDGILLKNPRIAELIEKEARRRRAQ
jgi:ATP-binding cassette subfamily B protein